MGVGEAAFIWRVGGCLELLRLDAWRHALVHAPTTLNFFVMNLYIFLPMV